MAPMAETQRPPSAQRVVAAVVALGILAVVVRFAALERTPPQRCPEGLVLSGGRCCGAGQSLAEGRCTGPIRSCGPNQQILDLPGESPACVLRVKRVSLAGGKLPAGVADWQVGLAPAGLSVEPFFMDRGEVTVRRYDECVVARVCDELPGSKREPGLPVTRVSSEDAEQFCRFVGGRLPTSAEWRFAASGLEGRRFPWGFTGLVCRRSSFGLVVGPCSDEGSGPDLAGARPAGMTPDGVLDLSGNVAEWTRDPDGGYRARGGSFRSRVAAELVTASVETVMGRADHVGFRCAYPPRHRPN